MAVTDTVNKEPEWPSTVFTDEFQGQVERCKVLVVGAGGIGCELLKTLVLSGFRNIEAIDLDTIETSNLNRQFLFRNRHVGQSKAVVAAAAVKKFCPAASIVAYQGNIKETRFDIDFFKRFDVVLNGLDNLEARRHVNRMCIAAQRPLVESGTAGYKGQVTVHVKGQTECYECQPKAAPRTYPICTIRNTPEKPIHCIVWAKDLLFTRLFGPPDAVTDLDEAVASSSAAEQEQIANAGSSDASFFVRNDGEDEWSYAKRVFERVFDVDIGRVASMTDLWKTRQPPTALQLTAVYPDCNAAEQTYSNANASFCASKRLGLNQQHQCWSTRDNVRVFLHTIHAMLTTRAADVGSLSFDKDDDLAVDFVTSASNLRALCYGIAPQSWFDAKGMAGSIIHAIATTNAIISGLIVSEAMKIIAGCSSKRTDVYVNETPSDGRMLVPAQPCTPNAACMVCGKAQITARVDTNAMTLADFIAKVVKKGLAITQPSIVCGGFMYEEGDGLDEEEVEMYAAQLSKTLASLPAGGIKHGSAVTLHDQLQDFHVTLHIVHQDDMSNDDYPEGFALEGVGGLQASAADKPSSSSAAAGPSDGGASASHAAGAAGDDEDDCMVVSDDVAAAATMKRKANADAAGSNAKRVKTSDDQPSTSSVVVDDADGDVVVLD